MYEICICLYVRMYIRCKFDPVLSIVLICIHILYVHIRIHSLCTYVHTYIYCTCRSSNVSDTEDSPVPTTRTKFAVDTNPTRSLARLRSSKTTAPHGDSTVRRGVGCGLAILGHRGGNSMLSGSTFTASQLLKKKGTHGHICICNTYIRIFHMYAPDGTAISCVHTYIHTLVHIHMYYH